MKKKLLSFLLCAVLITPMFAAPQISFEKWCKRNPQRCLQVTPDYCWGLDGSRNRCETKPPRGK